MDIYFLELNSYKKEILKIKSEIGKTNLKNVDNLTHFSIGLSNRTNLMLVGLCSLVEAFLYEIALKEEEKHNFKIDNIKGNGIRRLKTYLSRTNRINFGNIKEWNQFINIYELRNALVHSYGGMIDSSFIKKVMSSMKRLQIYDALIADRRIRLNPDILLGFIGIIESLLVEIRCQI